VPNHLKDFSESWTVADNSFEGALLDERLADHIGQEQFMFWSRELETNVIHSKASQSIAGVASFIPSPSESAAEMRFAWPE